MAGIGEPDCGGRTDLLALPEPHAFMAPGSMAVIKSERGTYEHSRSLRHAGIARAAGAAEPAACARQHDPFGRMMAIRESAIGSWGQRAYQEDIVRGRFFGRSSFILNAPDAIRHVL